MPKPEEILTKATRPLLIDKPPVELLRVARVIQPRDPFSGRPTGPPQTIYEQVPAVFDSEAVPDGTLEEIVYWIDGSKERAKAATMAELQRGARPRYLQAFEKV